MSVEVRPQASASFADEVIQAVNTIPSRVQAILEANHRRVVVVKSLVEHVRHLAGKRPRGWPKNLTWEHAEGTVLGNDILVAEEHKDRTTRRMVKNNRAGGVSRHETGHALDECLGNFSGSKEFKVAYNADVAHQAGTMDPYYLQPNGAGESETFAEVFAQLHGGGSDVQTPNFLAAWPNVVRVIREKLR